MQPIQLTPVINAHDRGVPSESLKSSLFAISSELGFCAKDETSGQTVLRVVNALDQTQDNCIPMKAEAAILSPADPTICVLRIPQLLQAMSLSTKQPLGRHTFQQPVQIDHWQWLDANRLAIVCPDAVYVWTYTTDSFQVLFQRDPQLTNKLQSAKITNVQVEGDWAILQSVGLDPATQSV